jgi:hypothetical protein
MNPVTVNSSPKEILNAFKQSPYWMQLTKPLQDQAAENPVAWLEGHPYLYSWYPTFFKDAGGDIKSTEKQKQGAMKQVERPRKGR